MKTSWIVFLLMAASTAACAADRATDDASSEDAVRTRVTPARFKLYADGDDTGEPPPIPPVCDEYTLLELDGAGLADLREVVECPPDRIERSVRRYSLKPSEVSDCGRLFFGSGAPGSSIVIHDYRGTSCSPVPPPGILRVEETLLPAKPTRKTGFEIDPCLGTNACGAPPPMPTAPCSDGSMGGFTGRCVLQSAGKCGWESRECAR